MQWQNFIKYLSLPLLYGLCMILLGIYLISVYQLTFNTSPSEIIGYYVLHDDELQLNSVYQVCLSNKQEHLAIMGELGLGKSNSCHNGYVPLLKTIIGMPNDIITITDDGVLVNSELINNSLPIRNYKGMELKPLPIGYSYKLRNGEYWLLGSGSSSYDSRYFGPVTDAEIKKRAILVFPMTFLRGSYER